MLTPRKLPTNHGATTSPNFFKRIIREILYYNGAPEPVVNFLFLIPIFAFLILFLGRPKAHLSLTICLALSVITEFLQRFIPGRVSSAQDLLLNCLGALFAFLGIRKRYLIAPEKKPLHPHLPAEKTVTGLSFKCCSHK